MIAAHHKSVYKDTRELGLLDLDDMTDCFEEHIKDFAQWSPPCFRHFERTRT